MCELIHRFFVIYPDGSIASGSGGLLKPTLEELKTALYSEAYDERGNLLFKKSTGSELAGKILTELEIEAPTDRLRLVRSGD